MIENREKKNQFLVDMHSFRLRIQNFFKTWNAQESMDLTEILLDKTIMMENVYQERFSDSFYQTLIGDLWLSYSKELVEEYLSQFEQDFSGGGFFRGFYRAHLRDKLLDSYDDTCSFVNSFSVLDLELVLAGLVAHYIMSMESITESEVEETLVQISKEFTLLGGEECALQAVMVCVDTLEKNKDFQKKLYGDGKVKKIHFKGFNQ